MVIEIFKNTPPWVYGLFFVLLALGYSQSKARTVSRGKVSILPLAMIALSFYGILSAFGVAWMGLVAWTIGVAVSLWLGLSLGAPHGVSYSGENQSFSLPGSWQPLGLMMAVFFTKYAVGVILARQLPFATGFEFIGLISLAYGFFGGLFIARALVICRSAKNDRSMSNQRALRAR